jgi:putative oxidoreductase
MGKAKNIILWVLQIGLAAAFIFAGWPKLAGAQMMVDMFNTIGVGQWFRYVTGGLEILSAVLLLIPGMAGPGAVILTCVMTGAIITHFTILHSPPTGPVVLLVLTVIVLVGRWSQVAARLRPAAHGV